MFGFARWIVRRGFLIVALLVGCGYLLFSSDKTDQPKSAWAKAPVAAAVSRKSDSMVGKLADQAMDKAGDYAEKLGVKDKASGLNTANDAFNKARVN